MSIYNAKVIENAVINLTRKIAGRKGCTFPRLKSESELWKELVACNLGSRVKYELSKAACDSLERSGLLNNENYKNSSYEHDLATRLAEPVTFTLSSGETIVRKYPFPNQKANHISRTAINLYSRGGLTAILESSPERRLVRGKIMEQAVGIGPKQASLFLRNIGYDGDMAVLDLHVLRYMNLVGLLKKQIKAVPKLTSYEAIESTFSKYAMGRALSVASLDVAIWVVMRVYQQEFA